MKDIGYLDFDLLIESAGTGYRAQVLRSPFGEAHRNFEMPFSDLEVENFLLRIGNRRRGTRRLDSPEMEAAKVFGGRLFNAVFDNDVENCLLGSINEASRQGKGLRIRLRLTNAPDLADLPWEYLYNPPPLNRFLALSTETPIVRYLDLPEPIRPLEVETPLRVLVLISSPTDYPKLDVEAEWSTLRGALSDLEQRGLVSLDRAVAPTLASLRRQLRESEYHIFHFIGHGGFDKAAQDGVLVLEDEHQRGRCVSGQEIGTLLQDRRTLRLAILNACEGARTSRSDPFAGVAQSLIQQRIPAVIAMQFEITDLAAITFAREFYSVVAGGCALDTALAEARLAIFAEGYGLEWGTPVLYLRAPDGRIFDFKGGIEEKPVSQKAAPPEPSLLSFPYVARTSDPIALNAISKRGEGVTITIKGPRQVGKSSLLIRMMAAASAAGKAVAYLDFQLIDKAALADADSFLRQFCAWLTDELGVEDRLDDYWAKHKNLSTSIRCTRYVGRYLLKEIRRPLVIAMDEVDTIFDTRFQSDFFGMLRAWHGNRANPMDPTWKELDMVLVTSTEPHYFIDNLNQSPFNVGLRLSLEDFTPEQVAELNSQHHSPLSAVEENKLVALLGGHPYLVQLALTALEAGHISASDLFANAIADPGPFADHLRNLLLRLQDKPELIQSLAQVIQRNTCPDDRVFFRLRGAGLVRREGQSVLPRCRLYADYFREHLHV